MISLFAPERNGKYSGIYVDYGISAGFPSPADDFLQQKLSLDEKLIKDKEATFYARVSGNSMIGAGLDDGDLLIIDRSISPFNNAIAVCYLEGEFTVKRLRIEKDAITLLPENPNYKPIEINGDMELVIWGVVSYVIKKV